MLNFSLKTSHFSINSIRLLRLLGLLRHLWLIWLLCLLDSITRPSKPTKHDKQPKTSFLVYWIIQNAFLWFLNDASWPGNVAKWLKTLSTIKICNIESILQIQFQKMIKSLFYGTLDNSKLHFCDISCSNLINLIAGTQCFT